MGLNDRLNDHANAGFFVENIENCRYNSSMIQNDMILSASGWRKVFAKSGGAEDKDSDIGETNRLLCALIAETFADYVLSKVKNDEPHVALGTDTRPTGKEMADVIIRVFLQKRIYVHFVEVASAPEIMAYSKELDGFLYISASHNPIGWNGIKFGLNKGGVLEGKETNALADIFREKCKASDAEERANLLIDGANLHHLKQVYANSSFHKLRAVEAYDKFIRGVITGIFNKKGQDAVFEAIKEGLRETPASIVCDMNGSARSVSIDKTFIPQCGLEFLPFNDTPGLIMHEIIPEPENMTRLADVINDLHADGNNNILIGYMPDCDGDRGNIVFFDEDAQTARPITAQEIFALSVVSELAFEEWKKETLNEQGLLWRTQATFGKHAVVVNGPTSMRIDQICESFGYEIFRAEVGEANVVNLARQKRDEGYDVRILGEGSNGGNITYPSSVRDPVATLFAVLKMLTIRDYRRSDGKFCKGLFHIWCEKAGMSYRYKDDFMLSDVLSTLPRFATTGVSESRAVLDVKTKDKSLLKKRFQAVFTEDWSKHADELNAIYGFTGYEADITNGTKEVKNASDWANGNGGLKIRFLDEDGNPRAFIWMRPSGTEPVFRIMCDVMGGDEAAERSLLRWETTLLKKADGAEQV